MESKKSSIESDVLVIGGGQAGLAMGYYLAQNKVLYLIVDAAKEIGETWQNRYDSLVLFTPKNYSSLPGLDFSGDPNEYPDKDEVKDYLQNYAKLFDLNIKLQTRVLELIQTPEGFLAQTNQGFIKSKQVIIATGPFQMPFIPKIEGNLSKNVVQIHTFDYRNPFQIKGKNVLVIGGGNSGAQIAIELYENNYKVSLSTKKPISFKPQTVSGKSIFEVMDKQGLLNAPKDTEIGKKFKEGGDSVIGMKLKELIESGEIKLRSEATGFENDLVVFTKEQREHFDTIIWATGYKSDYSWIDIPNVLNKAGKPIEFRGVTDIKGLYFLGLPFMYTRNSGLLGGVGKDAEFLVKKILTIR
jgi:putative flavoprotein involved in K+ transport